LIDPMYKDTMLQEKRPVFARPAGRIKDMAARWTEIKQAFDHATMRGVYLCSPMLVMLARIDSIHLNFIPETPFL